MIETKHLGSLSGNLIKIFNSKDIAELKAQVERWEIKFGHKAVSYYKQRVPEGGYIVSYIEKRKQNDEPTKS
jgi:hypothetical protein